MVKRSKQYFRFSVDKIGKGKFTEHTTHLTSQARGLEELDTVELIQRPDHDFVDEVVINGWFHLEAMSRRSYWMNVAGVTIWVTLRKDGTVKQVRFYEAGEYDDPWPGVDYGYKDDLTTASAKSKKKKKKKKGCKCG